jgi:hypothetical protein
MFFIVLNIILCATLRAAIPMPGRLQERVSNRKNSVDVTHSVDELVKLDVAELCKIVKTKDTLIEIFRRKVPLISDEFYNPGEISDMCFGVHVAMRNNWTDVVEKYYMHHRCKLKLADRTTMAIWGSHLAYFEYRIRSNVNENGNAEKKYQEFFDFAVKNGELQLLQSDLKNIYGSADAMNWAAYQGDLAAVKWIHTGKKMRNDKHEKIGCNEEGLAHAALGNKFECVRYLFENCHDESNIELAIRHSMCHKDILNYLIASTYHVESISTKGEGFYVVPLIKKNISFSQNLLLKIYALYVLTH